MFTVVGINDDLAIIEISFDTEIDALDCELSLLNQGFTTAVIKPQTSLMKFNNFIMSFPF